MNKLIFTTIIFPIGLLASQTLRAQDTLYLSNLDQPSTGNTSVASDSWWAEGFYTGANSGGYALNSVQLNMDMASGNPSGLSASIFSLDNATQRPGSSLGTISGSLDPVNAGTYNYFASGITLLPNTVYFIVLTAATPIAAGSYSWRTANSVGQYNDGWLYYYLDFNSSNSGLSWSPRRFEYPEFAIYATPVPEPATNALLGLSVAGFGLWRLRRGR